MQHLQQGHIYPNSQLCNTYLKYFQQVGSFPVFEGARHQHGAGLGTVIKSVGRFLFPIVASAANSFLGNTRRGVKRGHSIAGAAKAALMPTIGDVVQSTGSQIKRKIKRRKVAGKRVAHKKISQKGGGKKKVYKAKRRSKKKRSSNRKFKRFLAFKKKTRTLPTNL